MKNTFEKIPIKWRERLTRAIADREYARRNAKRWEKTAGGWTQCAVGERRELLKAVGIEFNTVVGKEPYPHDPEVDNLGYTFFVEIKARRYRRALAIVNKLDAILLVKQAERMGE